MQYFIGLAAVLMGKMLGLEALEEQNLPVLK
jgi:hypothetical protein